MNTDCSAAYVSIADTGYFSKLVTDYIEQNEALKGFYQFAPDDEGLRKAIQKRNDFPIDRRALVAALQAQYARIDSNKKVRENIDLLASENTFTVCSAHQPNLLTGYLYFFYKIIQSAKLAQHLKEQHPENNFVPVFYIGSEDNDLEELGVFQYEGRKYRWNTGQTGAVGNMHTNDLQTLLQELFAVLGPKGSHEAHLKNIITTAYQPGHTIAQATRIIIDALLGEYGIVVIDPNDAVLKSLFVPIIEQEIIAPKAYDIVAKTSGELNVLYKAQAYARAINFFYMKEGLRERIEKIGDAYAVLNTDIRFSEQEMIAEIHQHPERFSPNVILRGLFQETILPNVAFIGGGSEVAYWMQLKKVFEYYKVFFPAIILRQSVLVTNEKAAALQEKIGLSIKEIFQKTDTLINDFIKKNGDAAWETESLHTGLAALKNATFCKIKNLDDTMQSSAGAAFKKMENQLLVLEKKIRRAAKRKMSDKVEQIISLKKHLFPNENLQERQDTFLPFYLSYGSRFFDVVFENTKPYGDAFLMLRCK